MILIVAGHTQASCIASADMLLKSMQSLVKDLLPSMHVADSLVCYATQQQTKGTDMRSLYSSLPDTVVVRLGTGARLMT